MTSYLVFRVLGSSMEFQSRVTADRAGKAVQKLVDQQPTPPDVTRVKSTGDADYVAVPESNFNRFGTRRGTNRR